MHTIKATKAAVASRSDLCDGILDDLLDRNMLGLLLSSPHMRGYAQHFPTYAPPPVAAAAVEAFVTVEGVDEVHQEVLNKSSGLYIEEAKLMDKKQLAKALDKKYMLFLKEIGLESDLPNTGAHIQAVEMAWRYRHVCATSCNSL